MTLPGPDIYYTCPGCGKELLQGSWLSGNNFGATYRTDGLMLAPMMPSMNSITRCSGCASFFWLEDATQRYEEASRAGWGGPRDRMLMKIERGYLPIPLLGHYPNIDLRERWLKRRCDPLDHDYIYVDGSRDEQIAYFRKRHLTGKRKAARMVARNERDLYAPEDLNTDIYARKLTEAELYEVIQSPLAERNEVGLRLLAWRCSNTRVLNQSISLERPNLAGLKVDSSEMRAGSMQRRRWVRWHEVMQRYASEDLERLDEDRIRNMRTLLQMLESEDDDTSRLIRAELHRHLGEFNAAITLAGAVTGADVATARDKIVELARAEEVVVANYGGDY